MSTFWSFGKKKGESDFDRNIRELRQIHPHTRRPNNDDYTLEVLFQVNNQFNTLRIFLATDFPSTKPVMKVVGELNHPWLDQFKKVTYCPSLNNWNQYSSLAEVVKDCLIAFQSAPSINNQISNSNIDNNHSPYPKFPAPLNSSSSYNNLTNTQQYPNISQSQYNIQSTQISNVNPIPYPQSSNILGYVYGNNSNSTSSNAVINSQPTNNLNAVYPVPLGKQISNYNSYSVNYDPQPIVTSATVVQSSSVPSKSLMTTLQRDKSEYHIAIPDIPISFPELNNLSIAQLERLLTDDVALEAHVASIASVEAMETIISDMRVSNYHQINKNLEKKAEFSKLVDEIKELKQKLAIELTNYNETLHEKSAKYLKTSEQIIKELQSRRNELENESDSIARSFQSGEISLQVFLQEYIDKRQKYQELCGKLKSL